jgi:hypothetical protein
LIVEGTLEAAEVQVDDFAHGTMIAPGEWQGGAPGRAARSRALDTGGGVVENPGAPDDRREKPT